ncbi:MAG: tRNA guanosine(34) transglycosylase Tgt [Deltaproteobacteria bacterium]|nr:tRNA guanosine(34) transglycosylase Tgt [Deltaproteobacteria bacterium]
MSSRFKINLKDKKTLARLGEVHLKNGVVQTPVFMPVGTHGAVRGLSSKDLLETNSEIMLANTYHLFARPGVPLIEKMGGLHSFSSWKRPILTDSGGFQVFSLAKQRKLTEDGVVFRNNFNGDKVELSPEIVVDAQERFGSDIMMVLDECPPADASPEDVKRAVERTTRWAQRSREARTKKDLALFPIVQGGSILELRNQSLKELLDLEKNSDPWEGIAIGGLSVGETKEKFIQTLYDFRLQLPTDRPRYLMGLGTPRDLVFAVAVGIDMFDCVLPSRNGRHGIVMARAGRMNIFNSRFTEDKAPIEEGCPCIACTNYSRAFIRHLLIIQDTLGGRLCTIHNVQYFLTLMNEIRMHIANGTFYEWSLGFLAGEQNIFLGSEKQPVKYPEAVLP